MASGKTPGLDGFPIECYKIFIDLLVPILSQVHEEMFDKWILSLVFNQVYITVIPKPGKDHIQCTNYHPISLINVYRNILTTVLANILQQAIACVISS